MIEADSIKKMQKEREQKIEEWLEFNCLSFIGTMILDAIEKGHTKLKAIHYLMPWNERIDGSTLNKNYCGKPIPKEFNVGSSQFINALRNCLNSHGYTLDTEYTGNLYYIINWNL